MDHYKDRILAWTEEYPHLSSAQIHDWLLERYPDLLVGESTVRSYVKDIREVYQIENLYILLEAREPSPYFKFDEKGSFMGFILPLFIPLIYN